MRRPLVIGNWKLHGTHATVSRLLRELTAGWQGVHRAEVVVCPSFAHIAQAYTLLTQSNIVLGAQDVSRFDKGAYTGEVAGFMLQDLGCHYVIVGHSERRKHQRETDAMVARKFQAAERARLVPILCVGESRELREQGAALEAIGAQLHAVAERVGLEAMARSVIAYEPLWAVGTGQHASPDQAAEVHRFIRSQLGAGAAATRVVYGGSVKPGNAADYFAHPEIDGVLVGQAALKGDDFLRICQAAELSE